MKNIRNCDCQRLSKLTARYYVSSHHLTTPTSNCNSDDLAKSDLLMHYYTGHQPRIPREQLLVKLLVTPLIQHLVPLLKHRSTNEIETKFQLMHTQNDQTMTFRICLLTKRINSHALLMTRHCPLAPREKSE